MKALVCSTLGAWDEVKLGEMPAPGAGPGQVVIDVHAAAANFPDVLMIEGKYQFKPPLPFTPGCELAGIVQAVGDGVAHVKPGDSALAVVPHGAFAEQALADAARVAVLPPGIDMEAAAAMPFTYGTSYHALKDRGQLAAGETLLVLGAAGGVGLAAVDLGKLMGARVIAAASSAAKLEACASRGADALIDYSREDLRERLKELTGGKGVDVVFDPVGGAYTEPALRSLAWRGRLLVVGFAAGEIPKIALNLALLKGCSIVGVFWGDFTRKEAALNRRNMAELVEWLGAGRIRPYISARYPLQRGVEAMLDVKERRTRGKSLVIVRWPRSAAAC